MQIILQPILFQLDKDIISSLEKALSGEFNAFSIVTAPPIKEIPEQPLLFDNQRNNGDQLTSYNGFQISITNHLLKQRKYLPYAILMHIQIA